jgi:hypothetical protein
MMKEEPMLSKLAQAIRSWSQRDPPAISSHPPITLGEMKHRQLNVLAMTGLSHDAAASDRLYWNWIARASSRKPRSVQGTFAWAP